MYEEQMRRQNEENLYAYTEEEQHHNEKTVAELIIATVSSILGVRSGILYRRTV